MLKACIYTLGCRVNQYESDAIMQELQRDGISIVNTDTECHICIINTCSVTGESDRKSKQIIRRLSKKNPNAVIVVTGCFAELNPQIASKIPGVDLVCGNNAKLKKRIDKMDAKHPIYNYGFTDKVSLLMDAADCIVSKPGGLTSSEALAKGLPMIIANPIPGQEDRNVEFLLNNGAAFKVSSTFPVDEAVYQMFSNGTRLKNIREIAEVLGKPNAMTDIAEFIVGLDEKR